MIKQYREIKKEYPDTILFFRLGDFYEMFFEDAKIASKVLGIALTSRNKSDKNPVPLCGVPHHSAESYLTKLLDNGYKVAICEQVEDPKLAKGIVKRQVVKVLTPGAIIDTENLDYRSNNYLASITNIDGSYGLSYTDISTGEFKTTKFAGKDELLEELSHLEPSEILLIEHLLEDHTLETNPHLKSWNPLVTKRENLFWDPERAEELLLEYLSAKTLESYGLADNPQCTSSCWALLEYIKETQMDDMPPLFEPQFYTNSEYLLIDDSTKLNLELLKTIRGDTHTGSFIWVMDQTVTAMGARMLKQWINYPLLNHTKINERLDSVENLKEEPMLRIDIRSTLKGISDIERLIGRICTSSAKPRDLGMLRDSSHSIKELKTLTVKLRSKPLKKIHNNIDELKDIREILESAVVENPPLTPRDGGIIRDGYNKELDELRSIRKNGKHWIAELEAEERKETGINTLKIGYNKVFGYYIEVTKANIYMVPNSYQRKQTLVNAERFTTDRLKEYEEKILGAEEKIVILEKELFEQIKEKIAKQCTRIRKTASHIARLDVLAAFAEIADQYHYTRPELTDKREINLKESRHPVVERIDLGERFVPNDIKLDQNKNQFIIITGPNMAGKSTLIRQVALTALMSQIGSFVPAAKAKLGITDRIFTRVGASDNLAKGQSTFMVEMVETGFILRHATNKSLVILDEIGRGTSTFDGMSIAWAVAEFLHDTGCRTLFATHYHELAELAKHKKRIMNYNIYVKEDGDKIVFLRKLIPGAASHSYGIQVAKLAGIPERVIKAARKVLVNLEKSQTDLRESILGGQIPMFEKNESPQAEENPILVELSELDLNSMTPLDALNALSELKKKLDLPS